MSEGELAAARHRTAIRRRAVDVGGPLAVALALLTAFGLANAAAVYGLSTAMAPWAAALVLAGAWVAVAALLALALRLRADRGEGWAWWRMLTGGASGERESLEAERARAEAEVRAALERVTPALGAAAASAAVPIASAVAAGMAAEVAAGAVETGSGLIEASDEIIESITVEMPGGGLVNQVWDVVLAPGRWGRQGGHDRPQAPSAGNVSALRRRPSSGAAVPVPTGVPSAGAADSHSAGRWSGSAAGGEQASLTRA